LQTGFDLSIFAATVEGSVSDGTPEGTWTLCVTLEQTLEDLVRKVVREELQKALAGFNPQSDLDPHLSVKDAAEALSVAPKTILRWIAEGKLPAKRLGRIYRIKERDLQLLEISEGDEETPDEAGRRIAAELSFG